jgi:hypothetical protein
MRINDVFFILPFRVIVVKLIYTIAAKQKSWRVPRFLLITSANNGRSVFTLWRNAVDMQMSGAETAAAP